MIAIGGALANAALRRNAPLGDDLVERLVSFSMQLLRDRASQKGRHML
jgi:hypothetical protein